MDASCTLEALRANRFLDFVLCRDLDGFFDHVWWVNPLAGASGEAHLKIGPPVETNLSPRHTFVEIPLGRWRALRYLAPANFAAVQWSSLRYLSKLIKRERISVIRVGEPYFQGPIGLWLARRHRIPVVVRINGNYDHIYQSTGRRAFPRLFPNRWTEKLVERLVLPRVDLVAAPNDDNLAFAIANGARKDRTAIFPYGNIIHPRHFDEPTERGTPADDEFVALQKRGPLLGFIGRLEPAKHVRDLVPIMAEVRKTCPDVILVIVGSGSELETMKEEARDLGISDAFAYVGYKDQEWIAQAAPHFQLAVSPHMGRALVETALAGVPMVAYDIDFQKEFVQNGVTGILVPSGDIQAAATAVCAVLSDHGTRRRMSAAAREHAVTTQSRTSLTGREASVYAALLDDRPVKAQVD